MSADFMTDLAAKIESALGEHTLRGGPRDWFCTGCTWSASTRFSGFATNDHRAHLARDVIAPLVEAQGAREIDAALAREKALREAIEALAAAPGYTEAGAPVVAVDDLRALLSPEAQSPQGNPDSHEWLGMDR